MKLRLAFPLKKVFVTQRFGKNNSDIYKGLGMIGHSGMDFRAPDGTPVYAAHDGRVTYAGYDGAGGLTIVIRTEEKFDYLNGEAYYKTVYCHLKKDTLKVTAGQSVIKGQEIAHADNTGLSTGSHLHFGLKPIEKGEQDWQWQNIEIGNGFYGSIDPEAYLPSFSVPFPNTIKYKDQDDKQATGEGDVARLQAFLLRRKLLKMPFGIPFGYYGDLTKEAVKKYQISKGIQHNGGIQVGTATLAAMNKDYDL